MIMETPRTFASTEKRTIAFFRSKDPDTTESAAAGCTPFM
jgi:hypothetical protein